MKGICIILLLVIGVGARAQDDSLMVSGRLEGLCNLKVFLSFTNNEGKRENYQTSAYNDAFRFKVRKQSAPVAARFSTQLDRGLSKTVAGSRHNSPAPALELFVSQSDIRIKGEAEELHLAEVNDAKENKELERFRQLSRKTNRREWEIRRQLFSLDAVQDSSLYQKLLEEGRVVSREQWLIQKKFIQDNPASFTSLFLLSRMENLYTTGEYAAAFENLADKYKQTALAQKIAQRIEFLSPTAPGKPAIPFVRKDKDGREINLADYKGRVVLLDFWGSWCSPCRASHPHLKELYSKYKDKGFAIIAIAQENAKTPEEQRAKWLEAIEKDGIHWTHVLNNEEKEKQDLVKEYRVTGFPTKILLDKDGKILLRVTASATDDIDRALEKIYGE